MRRLGRAILFFADHTFRSVAASPALARLLEMVSHEDHPAEGDGNGRPLARIPDLGYRAGAPWGDPVPVSAPRDIRAWQVQWKSAPHARIQGFGYMSVGGFYLPRTNPASPRPGILVLPVLQDRLSLASGTLARYFAAQGFAALEVRSGISFLHRVRVTPNESGPSWAEAAEEMIVDGRRALDWMCARPEVDARRLGIVGISYGAMIGSCVMGADSRLGAGVFCMGGADEAMIVARSRERSVRRFRERIMRAHGLTDPADLSRLPQARISRTEPMRYAPAVDPRSVLLFKTRLDRAVVPEAQDKLWEALGRPRRITLPLGHIGFGLAFYYAARRAAEFLRERLSPLRR